MIIPIVLLAPMYTAHLTIVSVATLIEIAVYN
jgi:hypothetical protein